MDRAISDKSSFSDAEIQREATSYSILNALPHQETTDSSVLGVHVFHDGHLVNPNNVGVAQFTLNSALQYVREHENCFVWARIHEPTQEEIAPLVDLFHLGSFTVEDIMSAHEHPKLEHHEHYDFFIARNVHYNPDPPQGSHDNITTAEVQVVVGKDYVLTFSHSNTATLSHTWKRLSNAPELTSLGPVSVLYSVLDISVDGYSYACKQVETAIDKMEQQVFTPGRDTRIEPIYMLKRETLEMRRAIMPLGEVLEEIHKQVADASATVQTLFSDIFDHHRLAQGLVVDHNDRLDSLLDSAVGKISLQQNTDMRKMSAWAALAVVPTIIGGIYGMNFEHFPTLDWQYGFYICLAVTFAICAILWFVFRRNKWL